MLPSTGTECIANKQTDRWESVICSSCALRRLSLPLPLQNYRQLHYIIIWLKFHPHPPSPPILTHFTHLFCESLVNLSLDLETCHETFGDGSYHRDWIHCEQTDILRDIYRYPIPPTPQPSPTLALCPLQPHVDLLLDLGKCHGKFGDATSYRGWMHSEQTDKLSSLYI